jgi:hypothetical protein
MEERILLVGEDPVLMATRAMLLSDWKTTTADPRQALTTLDAESFDAMILCQTVSNADAEQLIAATRRKQPGAAILAIGPTGKTHLGVRTEAVDLEKSPAWLRATVAEMLAERSTA